MINKFLPINKSDMVDRGWTELDFLFISGDAYVDHPSFATAVITRTLEAQGYKVGIICQPDWRNHDDFKKLGKPRLAVLISAGNLDSMLNKYTAAKKERKVDSYSAGGEIGKRPNRATIVYANRVREIWKKVPIIIGGIEASLRRFAHYDYWDNKLRRSILIDSKADLLIFGMGEKQIVEIADYLAGGAAVQDMKYIDGTAYVSDNIDHLEKYVELPSEEAVFAEKKVFAEMTKLEYEELDPIRGNILVQKSGDYYVVQNKPAMLLETEDLDRIYDLPYTRSYHHSYEEQGGVPALEEVKFGIISHRGCFGSCSFCAIHSHQGRIIQSRSHRSIIDEAVTISNLPDFKGYIHDLGGPTANFRHRACKNQIQYGACKNKQCLAPTPCKNLEVSHEDYVTLLDKVRNLPKIKKVFIRSGIRYDYVLLDKNKTFIKQLVKYHVSGQLKIAPEHISENVLRIMKKPNKKVYTDFCQEFSQQNTALDKKQYLVPYFMSSHPASTLLDAIELAEFLHLTSHYPEQVQDFIPSPGSLATAMYYAEYDPFTKKNIFVAKTTTDKAMQRALLQYKNPKNKELVQLALRQAGREDLMGDGIKCLIKKERYVVKKKK